MKKPTWNNDLLIAPRTMSEQVYDLLREKILKQEIKPGEILLEVDVSKALQISRTPVREALSLLQHDGLVTRNPRGGLKVTELTLEELLEVSEIRTVFEVYSIERTCDKITNREIDELEEIIADIDAVLDSTRPDKELDLIKLGELNTNFHDILYEAAGSDYLRRILEIVRLPILRYRPFSLETKKQRERSWNEHKLIVQLLKDRDKKGLKTLIKKHVIDAGRAIAKKLEEFDAQSVD